MTESDGLGGSARWAGIGAALLVLAALLWSLHELLNPLLLWLALVAVLLPFRKAAPWLPLVVTTGILAGFWLLSELGALLAPFVVAVVLAYILNPAVDWLARTRLLRRLGDRETPAATDADDEGASPGAEGSGAPTAGALESSGSRLPRTVAVAILAVPVAGGLAGAIIWGGPWAGQELAGLAGRAPDALSRLASLLAGLEERLARLRIPGVEGSELADRLKALSADDVVAFLDERRDQLTAWILSGALGVGRGVGAFLTVLGYLVLTPVVAFYLMRDWDRVVARAAALVPPSRRGILAFGQAYDRALAGYLRGQVTVSLLVGSMTAAGLLLVGFPYALLLGLIVAIFNVVPYLGLVLSLLPALGIALASGDVGPALLKVGVVYTVAQTLESAVFSPRIVGDSTGLHPVFILLAIAVSGFFFGFVGLLLAVPAAVGLKLLAAEALTRWRASWHPEGAPE